MNPETLLALFNLGEQLVAQGMDVFSKIKAAQAAGKDLDPKDLDAILQGYADQHDQLLADIAKARLAGK